MFEKREKLVLVIFVIIFIGILLFAFSDFGNKNNSVEDKNNFVVVHVTGEIKNPGVYRLEEGARVIDAVNLAGGPLPSADLDRINLANFLKDGSKIYIPPKDDNLDSNSKNQNALKVVPERKDKININTASKGELESLPGIGPTLAQRIIEYREENGLFSSAEDLLNVKGIGEKKLEKIKDQITW